GLVEPERDGVYSARERHSSSRYKTLGYPQRGLRTHEYLYVRNFHPERRPAGAPQEYSEEGGSTDLRTLGPMHGGYHDIDGCPTLTFLVENREVEEVSPFFHASVDHRPAEELFKIADDPACMKNLASDPAYDGIRAA